MFSWTSELVSYILSFDKVNIGYDFRGKVLAGHVHTNECIEYMNYYLDGSYIPLIDSNLFSPILINVISFLSVVFFYFIHDQTSYYLTPYTNNVSAKMMADTDDKKYYSTYYRVNNSIVDHTTFWLPFIITSLLTLSTSPLIMNILSEKKIPNLKPQYVLAVGLVVYLFLRMNSLKSIITYFLNQSVFESKCTH